MLPGVLLLAAGLSSGPGTDVSDLQLVGRWPTFEVARLASEALQNMSNGTAAASLDDDEAVRNVVARLCGEVIDAAAGAAVEPAPPMPNTTWLGGDRTFGGLDPCRSIPGRALVSCRGGCIPRAQCYALAPPEPCSMLGASGVAFAECHGGCVPRGRCAHALATPSFEISAYVGQPSSLENRSLAGGALMLPPGTLGVWNETAARLETMAVFNATSRAWELNASAAEPPAPPPVAVCAVRWHGHYMSRRRAMRQNITYPLPSGAYQPLQAQEQNVTVQTETVSLLVQGAWAQQAQALEPAAAVLRLPAQQPLPEIGRAPVREQRAIFRYCGRWGPAVPDAANSTNSSAYSYSTTSLLAESVPLSEEQWLLDELEQPEVVTTFTARPVAALVVNTSNCTNSTDLNSTNTTACNTTSPPPPPLAPAIYDRSDAAHCRVPVGDSDSVSSELIDLAVLAGPTRWAPIVPLHFAYMISRPELSSMALLVSVCSFLLFAAALGGSVQFRRTVKAARAATPGWLKQTEYARVLKHDLHPVLSLHTVLHTLRTRWSLPAATFPGPVAGDPFDFSQRLLVVFSAAMAALGATAALGSPWRDESCLAPCSARCYSETEVAQTAAPLEWSIRSDRSEVWHRSEIQFGDCDEVCEREATVAVELPHSVIVGGVLCAQFTCSVLSVLFRWLSEPYIEYLAPEHVDSVTVRACRWFRDWLPVAASFDFCSAVRRELGEICHMCWHRKPQKRLHDYTKRAFEGKLAVSMEHGDEKYGKEGIHSDTYEVGIRTFHKRLYPSSWAAAMAPYGISAVIGLTCFGLAVVGSSAAGGGCVVWCEAWLQCAATAVVVQLVIVDPVIAVGRMLAADCLHLGRWKKVVPEVKEFSTEEIASLFEELDANHSGALERNEVLALCKKLESGLLGVQFSEDDLEGAWHEMDADGKGDVSLGEFLNWWSASGSGNLGSVGNAVTSVLDGSAVDPTGLGTVAVWQSKLETALEAADNGRVMRLRVQVVGCAGLPPKDLGGKNDVYASLEMIGAFEVMEEPVKRTITVTNGGAELRWPGKGHTLAFDTLELPRELEVVVFDEDVASADDLIGTVTVSLEGKGLDKPSYGGKDHAKVFQEQAWHALTDDRGYPAGSILLRIHWAARDLTAEADAADMEKEYLELDAEEQGQRDGDKGMLLAIGDEMFDDAGDHEIEEWKPHEDQGVVVGVRGHACESVRQLVGSREALAFGMISEVLNPFRTNRMTKKQRKRLNIVLTEFLSRQSETAHRGARDWLMNAASAHVAASVDTDSEDDDSDSDSGGGGGGGDGDGSDGEGEGEGAARDLPGSIVAPPSPGGEGAMRPGHRDRTRLPPISGGEAGQAAYRASSAMAALRREPPPAKPRPGTAQRTRDMANAVQVDGAKTIVYREQAAAKLQLLRMLWEENIISNAIASARQEKVLAELRTVGISPAGLGYRYI
jgi:hypothetical protein